MAVTSAGTALPARPVTLLAMAAFVSAATVRVLDPMVPAIAGEFATTPGAVGLTVTAFTLAYGVCQLFWGPVGDRYGKYRVIALACLLSAGTAGAAALANSLVTLAALRLVSGVTAAAIIPLAMAFIGDHVAYEQRQATLARFIAGQIMGLIGGQIIGGVVGDHFGWRAVFLVLAGMFLVAGLLVWRELRSGRVPAPILGAPARPAQLAMTYLRLVRRPWPRTVLLTVFAEGFLFFGAFAYVGLALHDTFGLTFTMVGLVLGAFGLGGVLYALSAPALVRRLGERGLARGGGVLLAAGLLTPAVRPPGLARRTGDRPARPRLLHAAQHLADQRHPDGARGARPRRRDLRQLLLHRPGPGRLARRARGRRRRHRTPVRGGAPLLLLLALAFAHRLARRPAT